MKALGEVYSKDELDRLRSIGAAFNKMDMARKDAPSIGSLSASSPNRVIEMVARIVAANHGAQMGNGGSSIQIAAMASNRMKALLGNLQNDKAAKMLMDAVEDPELFKALLTDTATVKLSPKMRSKIAPYFLGGISTYDFSGAE